MLLLPGYCRGSERESFFIKALVREKTMKQPATRLSLPTDPVLALHLLKYLVLKFIPLESTVRDNILIVAGDLESDVEGRARATWRSRNQRPHLK